MRIPDFQALILRFFRFGLVGGAATVVHMAVFLSLTNGAGWNENLANLLAFLVAFGVSYIGHTRFSFRQEANGLKDKKQFARFMVATAVGFVSNMTIVFVSVTLLGAIPEIGAMLMVLITPVITFILLKNFVYRTNG